MTNKHLFFDLDRTLWDFEANSKNALKLLFKELGLNQYLPDFNTFHESYKKVNSELWRAYGNGSITKNELRDSRFPLTLKKFKLDDIAIANRLSEGYIEISPKQTQLFPKALETLDKLKSQGFNLHIITNGFKEVQYIKLENSKLHSFFDVIICSEEVGHNKPSPLIFAHALKLAGAGSYDSVMIGDDYLVDVVGAQKAGLHGILFDPHNTARVPKDEWKIKHLSELEGILPFVLKRTE